MSAEKNVGNQGRKVVIGLSVLMLPFVTGVSAMVGNGFVVASAISVLFILIGLMHMANPDRFPVAFLALALVGQPIALTAALTGHPWQIDAHMIFFAALAVLVILLDTSAIIVATVAIAVHHLSLTLMLPALVYPAAELSLLRTVFHAAVVLMESATLIVTIKRIHALADENAEQIAKAEEASRTAGIARDQALESKREGDRLRQQALDAQAAAEAARVEAEEKHRQAESATTEVREKTEAEVHAARDLKRTQDALVTSLGRALKALADGDLSLRLTVPFPAEYDALRTDYNEAAEALSAMIAEVAALASDTRGQTDRIDQTTTSLSQRAERQAMDLAEAARDMKQVTETVHKSSQGAADAKDVVFEVRATAERSSQVVEQASTAMSGISQSAGEINTIIDVIEQIAFQTNLLALNAGVEAARAGETGRGFAVVASEVRALAQRSSEAARDISDLIAKSQAQVDDGVRLVAETVKQLQTMSGAVRQISEKIEDISASTGTQAEMMTRINSSVSRLDGVTRENADMLEGIASSTRNLSSGIEALDSLTSRFERSLHKTVEQSTAA